MLEMNLDLTCFKQCFNLGDKKMYLVLPALSVKGEGACCVYKLNPVFVDKKVKEGNINIEDEDKKKEFYINCCSQYSKELLETFIFCIKSYFNETLSEEGIIKLLDNEVEDKKMFLKQEFKIPIDNNSKIIKI